MRGAVRAVVLCVVMVQCFVMLCEVKWWIDLCMSEVKLW